MSTSRNQKIFPYVYSIYRIRSYELIKKHIGLIVTESRWHFQPRMTLLGYVNTYLQKTETGLCPCMATPVSFIIFEVESVSVFDNTRSSTVLQVPHCVGYNS